VVANPLQIDVPAAAEAVLEVVNENMAGQIRLVTIDQGFDARRFALVAFGGAGPLHACAIVRKLHMVGALVPVFPGITSALGCTLCDVRHEFGQTVRRRLDDIDLDQVSHILASQRERGREMLREQGVDTGDARQEATFTMMYEGQRHPISVEVPPTAVSDDRIRAAFAQRYETAYGRLLQQPVVIVSVRSSVSGRLERLDLAACTHALRRDERRGRATTRAWFGGKVHETAVVARGGLDAGDVVAGPAVITQRDSTTIVDPDFVATVLPTGNLWLQQREH
jgi:N-methylhydantoinase A